MNINSLPMKWRIVIPVASVICLLFALSALLSASSLRQSIEFESSERAKEVSAHYGEQIGDFINKTSSSLHTIESSIRFSKEYSQSPRKFLSSILKDILPLHPQSVGIWLSALPNGFDGKDAEYVGSPIADKTGRMNLWWTVKNGNIELGEPSSFEEEEGQDYFKLSRETGKDQLIDPYVDEVGGEKVLMTSLTLPIKDNGKYVATFGIDLSLANINKIVNAISPYTGSQAYLISSSGKYISHPDKNQLSKEVESEFRSQLDASNASRTDMQFSLGDYFYQLRPIYFEKIEKPWFLMIKIPHSVLKQALNRSMLIQAIATAASIIIIIGLIMFIISHITKGLYHSASALQKSSKQVAETADGLSHTSQELSSATTEQAASVEETTASLEEISGMVSNNVQNAEEAFNIACQVKAATEKGSASMNNLQEAMKRIKESNKKIEDLVQMIEAIADKTAIMDDIVFQTKLLSFNASVEAERAGEHGRGFAVVAQEVGNLAQLTGKSAQEIAGIVKESIEGTKAITTENDQRVREGDQFALEVANHFITIKEASDIVANRSKQVLEASKEQSAGVKQINIAMAQVDKANQINTSKAEETASSSVVLEQQSESLEKIVDELTEIIEGKDN